MRKGRITVKFIHIADLHLGKRMNDISLLEDQQFVLKQIVNIAEGEKADAVLIAGDVYDKTTPTGEAMTAFNDFLTGLSGRGIKVFVIGGNHDSDRRISYFSSLIKGAGIYVSEKFNAKLQSFAAEDEFGELYIHLLPFIKPINVRSFYPDEKIDSYDNAIEAVLKNSSVDIKSRNILLCHQFITGGEACDSEELSIGGLDNVSSGLFEAFDYVALGHLHKAQKVSRETLRYAGSPLKYSFSEIQHKKSVAVVNIGKKCDNKAEISIELVPLKPLHEVREVKGSLGEIMKTDYSEDYVKVTVTDEIVPPDARITVGMVFPNMMSFGVQNSRTDSSDTELQGAEKLEEKPVTELFSDFYRLQNNDVPPTEEHLAFLQKIINEKEAKES